MLIGFDGPTGGELAEHVKNEKEGVGNDPLAGSEVEGADFERETVEMGIEPVVYASCVGGKPLAIFWFESLDHGGCKTAQAQLAGLNVTFDRRLPD